MTIRNSGTDIRRYLTRGGIALAATCLSAVGAQAQVVQGMPIGEGGAFPNANVSGATTLGDSRAGFQIYAQGPVTLGGTGPTSSGPGGGGSTSPVLYISGPPGGGTSPVLYVSASGGQNAGGQSTEPGGGGPVSPIPEPGTWLMMIAGFGLIGRGLRQRAGRPVTA